MSGGLFCWQHSYWAKDNDDECRSDMCSTRRCGMVRSRRALNLSVQDKLHIARHLDDLGVDFIEGGWPGAIPRTPSSSIALPRKSTLSRPPLSRSGPPGSDGSARIRRCWRCGTRVRRWSPRGQEPRQARRPRVANDAGGEPAMVRDTVEFLRGEGRRVFVDCEHFFNGYLDNPAYATQVVQTAGTPAQKWSCCATPTAGCCRIR